MGRRFRQEAPERRWLVMNTRWWYQTIIYNYMEPLEPQHLSLGSGADLAHVTTVSVRHCGRQEAPERRWLGMNTRWWYQTIIYTWNPSNPRPVFDLPPASPSSRSFTGTTTLAHDDLGRPQPQDGAGSAVNQMPLATQVTACPLRRPYETSPRSSWHRGCAHVPQNNVLLPQAITRSQAHVVDCEMSVVVHA